MKKSLPLLIFVISLFGLSAHAQDDALKAGQSALLAADYKHAQTDFTTYTNSFSHDLPAYLKKEHGFYTSSGYDKATYYADFQINHDWANGYYGLGISNLNLGQKDMALKNFETAISIDPMYAEAYYHAGVLKKEKGDKTGACIYIGKALTYNDTMKAAKSAYIDNFCWSCGLEYFKKGKINVQLKQYADALPDLKMAVTISPDSGNYIGYLAMAYHGVGKADSAVLLFDKAIRVDPKSFSPYYYRGIVNEEKQKNDEAFTDLSMAIKLNPNSVDAYLHRAAVCVSMDKESSSIYDYQQVIRLKPEYGEAYFRVALYRDKLGQDACDYFAKALELGIDDAQSYVDACKKAASKHHHHE